MKKTANTVDMWELLARDLGELLYDGPEGAVVRKYHRGMIASDIIDPDALLEVLRRLNLPEADQFVVKSKEAFSALEREYGFTGSCPCTQWVYLKKEPPVPMDCDIRPLPMEYAQQAASHYHLIEKSLPYIRSRIEAGQVFGLFEEGKLAGFIGTHSEGAIGMLEVFPEYRRKGYGYALEAYIISWILQRGWTPYCHVVEGNDASVRLQQKLGMECAELPALWIY